MNTSMLFVDLCCIIIKRVYANYDAQVVISGGTGEGKSTLAIHLAKECDPNFTIQKNIFYTREQAIEAIKDEKVIPRYSAIILDEAINLLFRRDAMKGEQKQLLRLLDMCRKRNLIVFWAVPSFFSLDTHFINTRVQMWFYVYERGKCHIYMPLKGEQYAYIADPWLRQMNSTYFTGWKYHSSRNFKGTFYFPKLEDKDEREYLYVCGVKGAGSEQDKDEED